MKKTIICHFFNEEFLLPYFLKWHKNFFTDGIFINYGSTDNSCDIIRELCPSYEIVKPKYNNGFHARDLDREVVDAEKSCEGWKLCMNVTEFVFHDDFGKYLDSQPETVKGIWLPVISMVENERVERNIPIVDDKHLVLQRTHGQFGHGVVRNTCNGRLVHRSDHGHYVGYGRHSSSLSGVISPGDAYHLWFGWSPWTEQFIKRKDQIKGKITDEDMKAMALGTHMQSREDMISTYGQYQRYSSDLMNVLIYKQIYDRIKNKYGSLPMV